MKEIKPVIELETHIDIHVLDKIVELTSGKQMMMVRRNYFFVPPNGYSIYQACNYIEGLSDLINMVEEKLVIPEFKNTRIVDKGLAMAPGKDISCTASNNRNFDFISRHVRIPLSGKSTLAGIALTPGNVYIIDDITGYEFVASKDSSHLVYSFVSDSVTDRIWDLWKIAENR
jgi:hypothetical protein